MNNVSAATATKLIPTSKTRTWHVTLPASYGYGSAPVFFYEHEVTLSADERGNLTAEVDGKAASLNRAVHLLRDAKAEGKLVLLREAYTDTLDKAGAHQLHANLGKIGIKGWAHYRFASAIVGREITSLTQVRAGEVGAILGAALHDRGKTSI